MKSLLFSHIFLFFFTFADDENIADNTLYRLYYGQNKYTAAVEKADSILKIGKGDLITANIIKADYILYRGNTQKALAYIINAKKLLQEKETIDPVNQYMLYYIQSAFNVYDNNYFNRLDNFVNAKKIKEEYGLIDPYYLTEENIVFYYNDNKNYTKTFSIIHSVFTELKNHNIKYHPIKSALFRANSIALRETKKYVQSQSNLDSAMLYAHYYNDSTQIARVYKYQSELYFAKKQYQKALKTALHAKELFEKYDQKNLLVIYELLGKIYYQLEDFVNSKKYLQKVVVNPPYIFNLKIFKNASYLYQQLLRKEGNINKAYEILKNEIAIQRKISGQNVDIKLHNLELDYQKFKNNATLKKRKQRTLSILYILVFVLIGMGLLSLLLYQRSINIKKLKQTQKSIEKANKKLKNINFKLNKFGKIVSHDLKAPIRSIDSLTTFIEEDEPNLSESSKKYIELIHESVMTTENLILNMLTLARSEHNTLSKNKVHFNEIIKQVKANLLYDINRSNAQIILKNSPHIIYGNKLLLIQLFQNLIQNSIKYREGNRNLLIELDYDSVERKMTIQDNGIGIDSKNLDKLFEAYNQLQFESTDKGIGLGLYITKTIANLHDITIKIESKINEGTLINLYFKENTIQ
ncbi:histidine kinase [Flavobacteriaceae bacterium UJ101]|nr:histidine kinase [Flavobacteriaceae bacterium UJ101]